MIKNKFKPIFIIFVVVILFSGCSQKTDWDLYELNGKVKSFTETFYEPVKKSDKWEKGEAIEFGNYSLSFTENGDYKEMAYLDKSNNPTTRMVAKKENDKVVEELRYDADGELQGKITYTYVSDDVVEFTSYSSVGEKEVVGKNYLENGKILQREMITYFNGETQQDFKIKFLYGKNRFPLAVETTFKDNEPSMTTLEYVEFDEYNNWTKRIEYIEENGDKTPQRISIRTYEYY